MNEDNFKKITNDLLYYARGKLGYKKDPDVVYTRDEENAAALLGRTAHYDPANKCITVYISNRHPKDILRSLSHELVHHAQCCRGDLNNTETPQGYAQKDPHMRKMEAEAYLKGNMIFRDWEDEAKSTNKFIKLKFIGENNMSSINKIKDLIKDRVLEILEEKKKPDADGDGVPDWADKKPGKDDHTEKGDRPKKKAKKGEIPPQLRKHVKGKKDKKEDEIEEGNRSPKDKDGKNRYVKHPDKEGVHGVVTTATDKRTSVRYSDGTQRSHDSMERLAKSTEKAYKDARKTKKESASELTDRKAEQSSINHLNEQRLLKLNQRLIEKLIK